MSATREQRAIARAELTIAQRLGLGGSIWDVSRPSGDGVGAAVTPTALGAWAGYVAAESSVVMSLAAPGATIDAQRFYAVGASGGIASAPPTEIAVSDILTSRENPALRYSVAARNPEAAAFGYVRYSLDPL